MCARASRRIALSSSPGRTASRRLAIDAVAEIGEAVQEMQRIAAVARVLVQRFQALGIVGPARSQMRSKNALKLRKSRETERLREAYQGRGLHSRALGNARGGPERDFVGMVEREGGGLAQALWQRRLDLYQPALQRLEVPRGLHRFARPLTSRWANGRPRPVMKMTYGGEPRTKIPELIDNGKYQLRGGPATRVQPRLAPRPAIKARKFGKLVAIIDPSSTVIGFRDAMPMIRKLIAMR